MLQPRAHVVHTEFAFLRNHVGRVETKILAGERPHRTQVHRVERIRAGHFLAGEGGDVRLVAAARDVELLVARHVAQETHAAIAQNAALLVEDQGGADVPGLVLLETGEVLAAVLEVVLHVVVLQRALAGLVADGTVQRVVEQQHLLHRRARAFGGVAVGVHHHALGDHRLARDPQAPAALGDELHLAHAAVAVGAQAGVVAEVRDVDAVLGAARRSGARLRRPRTCLPLMVSVTGISGLPLPDSRHPA